MPEIGIGLVGAGWMGGLHSASYRRVPAHFPDCAGVARLVAVADEVPGRAEDVAGRFGYERWTSDWRDVLDDPAVEAVSIATPNHAHRELALAAAERGKHIWLEKPAGRFPKETAEIAAAAERAGIRTTVGLNYRLAPAVRQARALIERGELGEIDHFRMQFVAGYASSPQGALSWRFSRELAGLGVLGDLGSHAVDLAQLLLGPIARVTASTAILVPRRPRVDTAASHFSKAGEGAELGKVENEDWAAALVEFASGVRGTLELSRVLVGAEARYTFEVNGAAGAVSWDFERMNELQVATGGAGYTRVLMGPEHPGFAHFQPGRGIPMGYDDLKVAEARQFLQSISDGEQREPGIREMLSAARVIAALARSSESGVWEDV